MTTPTSASAAVVDLKWLIRSHLKKSAASLSTVDGREVEVWELTTPTIAAHLSVWAAAFRQRYCLDHEIDDLREGTGLSRQAYLEQLVFPDKSVAPGPGVRSGDFAELLVADYLEYLLDYWVPRGKYAEKASRDESVKGVDILGFRVLSPGAPNTGDTLLAFEVKAQCTDTPYSGRLQDAIAHSSKDFVRRAVSLNATKRRLLKQGDSEKALLVQRFQNAADRPYTYRSGAAAVLSNGAFDVPGLQLSDATGHLNSANLHLMVIRGSSLMALVHGLYERAANEA